MIGLCCIALVRAGRRNMERFNYYNVYKIYVKKLLEPSKNYSVIPAPLLITLKGKRESADFLF
jgi:hypothetical protein